MNDSVVFARPRHDYHSYKDFWNLVELSGYPLIYIDEIKPHWDDVTYIFSSPDGELTWPRATARIIYWLIEWYGNYELRDGVSETWSINRDFAKHLGAKFVPIGSHVGLRNPIYEKVYEYDLAHLSYVTGRRGHIYGGLIDRGLTLAPNAWGDQRNKMLSNSLSMLHIHQQEEFPAVAGLRAALAAAWSLPLLTENGWDVAPLCAEHMYTAPYDRLINQVPLWLKDRSELENKGDELHQYLCIDMPFRRWVEGAL